MQKLRADISEVCECTNRLLWDAYAHSEESHRSNSGIGRLVFVYRRDGNLRISEQEARFAFVEALLRRKSLGYSVEAPTSKPYSFSGNGERSAQTDLKLHELSGTGICNVEFKAKGVRQSKNGSAEKISKKISSIYKDVEKLLREPEWGLWFHLLESIDNSTINVLLKVIAQQIDKVQRKKNDVKAPGLTIHVCVLKHGFSLQKDVLLPVDNTALEKNLRVDLNVSRLKLKKEKNLNGWDLKRRC